MEQHGEARRRACEARLCSSASARLVITAQASTSFMAFERMAGELATRRHESSREFLHDPVHAGTYLFTAEDSPASLRLPNSYLLKTR